MAGAWAPRLHREDLLTDLQFAKSVACRHLRTRWGYAVWKGVASGLLGRLHFAMPGWEAAQARRERARRGWEVARRGQGQAWERARARYGSAFFGQRP